MSILSFAMRSISPTFLMAWIIILSKFAFGEQPPNIILIIADDMGWDGVSFHGGTLMRTPNIDALAYDGIILNNYYVQYVCSPSRVALLTGRYPIHTGIHKALDNLKKDGIRLSEKLLPEYLRELGYRNHILGKWHAGFYAEPFFPTKRGFDSHFGFLSGEGDYFSHFNLMPGMIKYKDTVMPAAGYDFRDGMDVDKSVIGKYTTELLNLHAEQIIETHNKSQPLFLQLAHQAVHYGNEYDRFQAPASYINRFKHVTSEKHRKFAAMHAALDDSVANVTKALIRAGMINNTVIVFTSDNGGIKDTAPNWPLRGAKETLWEGGTRVPAFIWSPLLEKSHYVSNHLMHISDWLPTLLHVAGYDAKSLPLSQLDGFDMWDVLSSNLEISPRTEVLYDINIDPAFYTSALRINNMKIILGSEGILEGDRDGWYEPPQNISCQTTGGCDAALDSGTSEIPSLISAALNRKFHKGTPIVVDCGERPRDVLTNCNPSIAPCLFDLDKDPCEYNNLASLMPEKVKELLDQLDAYNATAVLPMSSADDFDGLPIYNCGIWGPWIELDNSK